MFCSQCGVIIGRKFPAGLYKCPQCENILRVAAFRIIDEKDSAEFFGLESSRRRLCCLFVDEAKIKLLLQQQTRRPDAWLPALLSLEEERLKAFVKRLGWIISSVHRDPGPTSVEESRPFSQIGRDIKDSITNTLVITDFARVTRKSLHSLHEMALPYGVEIVAIAPHRCDENLEMTHVDYDTVPGFLTKNHLIEKIWTPGCEARLTTLIRKYAWHWTSYGADVITRELGVDAVRGWRDQDPACGQRHWKEVLTFWMIGHVRDQGLIGELPMPALRSCIACRRRFLPSAVPVHLAEMTDFRIQHCRTCLSRGFFYTPPRFDKFLMKGSAARIQDVESFVRKFRSMPKDELDGLLKTVLKWREMDKKSPASTVWLKSFIDAGLIKGYGALSSSETVFRALDDHACMSLGAALLDNFLHLKGIAHKAEVRYPRHDTLNRSGSLRSDFLVDDTVVEYAGLWGEDDLKKDLLTRVELCEKSRLKLVTVYTEDLICPELLEKKFERFVPKEVNTTAENEGVPSEEETRVKE